MRRINADQGSTIVMVLHDLSLAARYSDRLVVLHEGRVLADGEPWQVITPEVLAAAFGLEALVIADPASGRPMVVPLEPTTAGAAESGFDRARLGAVGRTERRPRGQTGEPGWLG